jgi:hypothetical protein
MGLPQGAATYEKGKSLDTWTPYGVVAFIIWLITAGSSQEVTIEQYLNPQNIEVLRLIASAANQTHFKLVIMNNQDNSLRYRPLMLARQFAFS